MTCPSGILGTFQFFCAFGTVVSPWSLVEPLFYPGMCPFHPGMCPFHPAVFPFPLGHVPWYPVALAGLPVPNAFCLVERIFLKKFYMGFDVLHAFGHSPPRLHVL